MNLPPRGRWSRCLQAAERAQVLAVASQLRQRYPVRPRCLPEAGLSLLQIREPSRGQCFYLGEIPVAEADLILVAGTDEHLGASRLLSEDQELVEAIACCDAALAAELPGSEGIRPLLVAGAEALAAEDRIRAGILQRTTVEFDLLAEDREDV